MLTQRKIDNIHGQLTHNYTGVPTAKHRGRWKSTLGETLIGQYLIIPITSSRMLKSEAYWMNNCCRDYAAQCAASTYTLFSIRTRSGERLATLGLVFDHDGYWCFDQCYGPSNSDVLEETSVFLDEDEIPQEERYPTELYYVAHEVVRLVNSSRSYH